MIDEPELIGDWIRERVLGSGAFGIVTLWSNSKTKEKIAIKKYRGEIGNTLTSKHKERWTKEVEMMQRINNNNIVNFCTLPPGFEKELQKYNPSNLPLLSMEYCTQGDLRIILSRSENCCGLPESDVRYILHDIMNAVSYLHTLKITHRDLKPENVVLQTCDRPNRIIYKLIDLGYAKEIDASSIAASFVGTLQYLAPEFFYSKTYSCSVDYWSMGLVAFEIICGVRPFLPNMSPAQWMRHVQQKKPENICIHQKENEDIEYLTEIFSENHVSSCFKRDIEKWLQLALEYNPKKRGYKNYNPDKSDNELVIFTTLQNILSKKYITIFSVYTYEFFSYEIDNFTLVTTLQGWIERDTKITKSEQFLLSKNVEAVKTQEFAVEYFDETYMDTMLYVFKKSEILKSKIAPEIPTLVKSMLEDTTKCLSYYFQKKSYAHGLYFIFKENKLYNTLLDACNYKVRFMLQMFEQQRKKSSNISTNLQMLISQKNFSKEILDFDVEQYLKHYSQNASHWTTSFNTVAKEIDILRDVSNRLIVRYDSAYRRIGLISGASEKQYSKYSQHELNDLLEQALYVFDKVRTRSKDKRQKSESCVTMVKVLYNVLKERDKLLLDKAFTQYMQMIVDIDNELEKIISPLNSALQHIEKIKSELLSDQISRQTKIWEFTIKQKNKTYPSEGSIKTMNRSKEALKPNFKIGNPSLSKIDNSEPISLDKPLHFILGDTSLDSNSSYLSSEYPVLNTQKKSHDMQITRQYHNVIKKNPDVKILPKHEVNIGKSTTLHPRFQIGAPTSSIINDNLSLRYELQEKTNESFLKCKSILSETLDFDFLDSDK